MVSKKGLISLFLTLSSIAVGQSSNGPIESGLQPICDVPSDLDLSGSWRIGSRPTYIEHPATSLSLSMSEESVRGEALMAMAL